MDRLGMTDNGNDLHAQMLRDDWTIALCVFGRKKQQRSPTRACAIGTAGGRDLGQSRNCNQTSLAWGSRSTTPVCRPNAHGDSGSQ